MKGVAGVAWFVDSQDKNTYVSMVRHQALKGA